MKREEKRATTVKFPGKIDREERLLKKRKKEASKRVRQAAHDLDW